MKVHESVLDTVGETPLVRLARMSEGLAAAVYAKIEFTNPGGSIKDRAALAMVRDAERSGQLRPGGVIVEATSGNTGIGLAVVAAQFGYRSVFVVPDVIAKEKITLLRAYGAEVVTTDGKLPREDPEHVKNLAARIAARTPGGWYANQYDNPANPRVHELTTGPEIWQQTGGRVTHLVAGIGTGGTITGTGRHLRRLGVQVVAADPFRSEYGGGDGSPYYVESVGHYRHPATVEPDWPLVYDPDVIDRIVRVPDRESLLVTRRLAREEGLLVGGSSGTAVAAALRLAAELGPDDLVVAILPDSGRNYLSKYFDDDWMLAQGFMDADAGTLVRDVLPVPGPLVVVDEGTSVRQVLDGHRQGPIAVAVPRASPDPTRSTPEVLGVVTVEALAALVADDPGCGGDDVLKHAVATPAVGSGETVDAAAARLDGVGEHVLVLVDGRVVAVQPAAPLRG